MRGSRGRDGEQRLRAVLRERRATATPKGRSEASDGVRADVPGCVYGVLTRSEVEDLRADLEDVQAELEWLRRLKIEQR